MAYVQEFQPSNHTCLLPKSHLAHKRPHPSVLTSCYLVILGRLQLHLPVIPKPRLDLNYSSSQGWAIVADGPGIVPNICRPEALLDLLIHNPIVFHSHTRA